MNQCLERIFNLLQAGEHDDKQIRFPDDICFFFKNLESLLLSLDSPIQLTNGRDGCYQLKHEDNGDMRRIWFNKYDFKGGLGYLYAASFRPKGKDEPYTCLICVKKAICYLVTVNDYDIFGLAKDHVAPRILTVECPKTLIELATILKNRVIDPEGRDRPTDDELQQSSRQSPEFEFLYRNLEALKSHYDTRLKKQSR